MKPVTSPARQAGTGLAAGTAGGLQQRQQQRRPQPPQQQRLRKQQLCKALKTQRKVRAGGSLQMMMREWQLKQRLACLLDYQQQGT